MKKFGFKIFLLFMVFTFLSSSVLAADYLPKDKNDAGNIVIAGEEQYENLYVGGGSVVINKEILGDLFSVGGSVNVNAPIEKDLFAAGGNVVVSSPVGEDARMAGGNISINNSIGGDLLVAGGIVVINSNLIGGDLWAGAGVLNLNAPVNGDVMIGGGEVLINSTINGNLKIRAEEKLVFGPNSKVIGSIEYSGKKEAVVQSGAEIGEINFNKIESVYQGKSGVTGFGFGLFLLIKMIALFIVGLVFLSLFRSVTELVVRNSYNNFWLSLGVGILFIIVTPILSLLLLSTMIGFYLSAIIMLLYLLLILVSGVGVIFFIGILSEKWIMRKEQIIITWRTLAWGLLLGTIITLIPVIGWLFTLFIFMSVFGSILMLIKSNIGS